MPAFCLVDLHALKGLNHLHHRVDGGLIAVLSCFVEAPVEGITEVRELKALYVICEGAGANLVLLQQASERLEEDVEFRV